MAQEDKIQSKGSYDLIVMIALMVVAIGGYIKWQDNFFRFVAITIVVVTILLIGITGGSITRWTMSLLIYDLVISTGAILLLDDLIKKIKFDNQNGSLFWPMLFFSIAVFIAIILGKLLTFDWNRKWILPMSLSLSTLLYSVVVDWLSDFVYWGLWIESAGIVVVILNIMFILDWRMKKKKIKTDHDAIRALLITSGVTTSLVVLLTIPAVVSVVLGAKTWWNVFIFLGGIISASWLNINIFSMFRHRS